MTTVIKPPDRIDLKVGSFSLFLAGSIEMGAAEDWQKSVEAKLSDLNMILLNPRRENWDSSWEQRIDNPNFNEQVNWEISGIERADAVLFYFAPGSKAPITLWELGFVTESKKVIVCCPEGFWRKGNIEVICNRFNIPLYEKLEDAVVAVRKRFMSTELKDSLQR